MMFNVFFPVDASVEENNSGKHAGRGNNNMLHVPQEGDQHQVGKSHDQVP